MTRKLLTVEDFRASAKAGARPDGTVMRVAAGEPVGTDDAGRKIRFVFSDASVDRAGDSISADGWQTDDFMKNPVALWAHDSYEPPIGRASNVGPESGKLMGDIEFMAPEMSAFADTIYRMVLGKYINAVSVGFIPLEYSFVEDKDRPWGIDFKRQELLEISVCPVPCNPNALAEARSKGINTTPLRAWAEKLLDGGPMGRILVPRKLLEETFRAAKTPSAVRMKYLAPKKDASDEDSSTDSSPADGNTDDDADKTMGDCGRAADEPCGMADPAECETHASKSENGDDPAADADDGTKDGDEDLPVDGEDDEEKALRRARKAATAAGLVLITPERLERVERAAKAQRLAKRAAARKREIEIIRLRPGQPL